ncbi:Methionyl-tRNA formyltransferase [Nymphon striatum]|nr:Methionyl-tRNA formyltransferase [Nymphon striatum]
MKSLLVTHSPQDLLAGEGWSLRNHLFMQRQKNWVFRYFTPESLKSEEEQQKFADLEADVAIVIAYGLLLPEAILEAPRLGCYNGHASLLPRWRGAAPIQRAIMAGDEETGVNVMKMDVGLDTGPVALWKELPISQNMTAGELHDQLSLTTAKLMVDAARLLENSAVELTEQSEDGVLYASKIEKSETRIDWSKPAAEVHNHIRGLSTISRRMVRDAIGWQITASKSAEFRIVGCKWSTRNN